MICSAVMMSSKLCLHQLYMLVGHSSATGSEMRRGSYLEPGRSPAGSPSETRRAGSATESYDGDQGGGVGPPLALRLAG